MKKRLFSGLLLSIICCLNLLAQSSSTEANPKWYYIQVKGLGLNANRVLTDLGDQVSGQPLATTDVDAVSRQLWRFEIAQGASGYTVINKYSKKQLSVAFDGSVRRPVMAESSPYVWSFTTSTVSGYKYVKILNEPQEGTKGDIYLSQTFYQNYALKLVSESDRVTDSEVFRCVLNEIPVPSTDDAVVWMTIRNPKTDKYLTDGSSSVGTNFILEAKNGSQAQQWKMQAKENGNYDFVNRATGSIISTVTNLNRYYYLNNAANTDQSAGWKFAPVNAQSNQYEISATDEKGVISYWNATTDGQAPEVYSNGNSLNSTYSWIFTWVEEIHTGLNQPTIVADNIRVYSMNRRIYVDGCDEYRITSLSGLPVRKNVELPTGIYLVTAKSKTVKILVK
ncbi:MAG: RICIN domain-containing protein [Dysgonamonadaceae bacterium]|jgi:hypothetical protein|nr:RICIN domain-containing protein [Dysgonamonadaceae bacterium]